MCWSEENCGIYEGTLVRAGAVLGAGTIPHALHSASTIYIRGEVYRATPEAPLEVPENASSRSRIARRKKTRGSRNGIFPLHPSDCESIATKQTDRGIGLEDWLR